MEHLEKAGGGGGGLGLGERERGSVFKQMGEMKKKIQVMNVLSPKRTDADADADADRTPDNAAATESCKDLLFNSSIS